MGLEDKLQGVDITIGGRCWGLWWRPGLCFQAAGFMFHGRGLGVWITRVEGAESRVEGAGSRVEGAGMRVEGAGTRVEGVGSRVEGAGLRV